MPLGVSHNSRNDSAHVYAGNPALAHTPHVECDVEGTEWISEVAAGDACQPVVRVRATASVEVLRSQVPIRAATESEPDRPVGAPPCHRQGSRQIPRREFSQRERKGGGGEGFRASTQETRLSLYATCGSHVRAPLLRGL